MGAVPEHPEVRRAYVPRLFSSTADYFDEALRQVCRPNPEDQLSMRRDDDGTIAFEPPRDLLYRLKALPKSYLDEQRIMPRKTEPGRMRITFSKDLADRRLKAARESSKSQWPNVSYVTDVHPVLDWLTDKVLVEVGRHQAPCSPPPWTHRRSWYRASAPTHWGGPPSSSGWPSTANRTTFR